MFIKKNIVIPLLLALLEGCAVLVSPTPTTTVVTINPQQSYQIMEGIGINSWAFPIANIMGWQWGRVKKVFDDLNLHYVRLVPWFDLWEMQNDNEDATSINWSYWDNRNDDKFITPIHDIPFAQYVTQKGLEVQLGIWRCADWLASGKPRHIAPEKYDELGESISAYLLYMQQQGVPIDVIEVQNEPDIQAGIQYESPEALRDAALQVIAQLDRHGLNHVKLHAPNLHSPRSVAEWGEAWFNNPLLAERTAAVSYHTWWVSDYETYHAIWEFAKHYHKPVWATETGYCASRYGCTFWGKQHYIEPATWETAWDYAMSTYRAIAWSHASRIYHWALLGHDGAVGNTGKLFPTYYILKHFANYISPGAILIESSASDSEILTLAFKQPHNAYTLILLNQSIDEKKVRLLFSENTPFKITSIVISFQDHYEVATKNSELFNLPAESIASISVDLKN